MSELKKLEGLKPLFATPAATAKNAAIGLDGERALRRPSAKRHTRNMLAISNAAKAIDVLPAQGESIHIAMAGNFAAWEFVPATLRLATPATIDRLTVSTLGFSDQNTTSLVSLLDSGQIKAVLMLASVYFKDSSGKLFEHMHHQLTARGHRLCARRTHAKILAMELSDGRAIVIEMSSNLRSCRNVEQATIFNDRHLLDFHRTWIEELANGTT